MERKRSLPETVGRGLAVPLTFLAIATGAHEAGAQETAPTGTPVAFAPGEQEASPEIEQALQGIEIITSSGELIIKRPNELDTAFFKKIGDSLDRAIDIYDTFVEDNDFNPNAPYRLVVRADIVKEGGEDIATQTPESADKEEVTVFVSFTGSGLFVPPERPDAKEGDIIGFPMRTADLLKSLGIMDESDIIVALPAVYENLHIRPSVDGAKSEVVDLYKPNEVLAIGEPDEGEGLIKWIAQAKYDPSTNSFVTIPGEEAMAPETTPSRVLSAEELQAGGFTNGIEFGIGNHDIKVVTNIPGLDLTGADSALFSEELGDVGVGLAARGYVIELRNMDEFQADWKAGKLKSIEIWPDQNNEPAVAWVHSELGKGNVTTLKVFIDPKTFSGWNRVVEVDGKSVSILSKNISSVVLIAFVPLSGQTENLSSRLASIKPYPYSIQATYTSQS